MAEIQTYSPRKVTDQNRDLLPSNHDPEKRTTYVQITLNEPELKEAIRNYIRAQVPVSSEDELPVKIIAGRGENGHSAEITVSVANYKVASPDRPTAPLATFEAVAEDAARRNDEHAQEAVGNADTDFDMEEVLPKKNVESVFAPKNLVEEETSKTECDDAPVDVTIKKKSSLFESTPSKDSTETVSAKGAAAPPEEESETVTELQVATETPRKVKSIFDA